MRENILIFNPSPKKSRIKKRRKKNPYSFNSISKKLMDINGKMIAEGRILQHQLNSNEINEIVQNLDNVINILNRYVLP